MMKHLRYFSMLLLLLVANVGFADEVQEETVPVTIDAAEYATLYYSDKAFEIPEGVTAHIVISVEGGKIVFEELSGVIPAGTAVVLNGPQGTYDFKVVNDNSETPVYNMLRGYDFPHLTEGGDKYYKLTVMNDKVATGVKKMVKHSRLAHTKLIWHFVKMRVWR